MIFRVLPLCLCAALCQAAEPAVPAAPAHSATPAPAAKKLPPLEVKIEMRDGLRFDPPRFAAQPGQEITVSLTNADTTHQQHNFLVAQPGKLKEIVQQSLELGEKGPKQGFIPENASIIVHSEVLDPEKEAKVKFTLPPHKGIYPFVCSMPGHGMIMYGAIYAGEKMPPASKDPNLPPTNIQHAIAGGGQRPWVQRIFMPESGPASIAVALPGTDNYCWDAGECRLRYAWSGDFLDASAHWRGNGKDMPVLSADPWWSAPKEVFPLQIGEKQGPVKFLGYSLREGLPEFHYRVGATEVFERITANKGGGLSVHFRLPKVTQAVRVLEGSGKNLTLEPAQAGDFSIIIPNPAHP